MNFVVQASIGSDSSLSLESMDTLSFLGKGYQEKGEEENQQMQIDFDDTNTKSSSLESGTSMRKKELKKNKESDTTNLVNTCSLIAAGDVINGGVDDGEHNFPRPGNNDNIISYYFRRC